MESIIELKDQLFGFFLRPYIFPFYIAAIWIGALFRLSRRSGWTRLAERFATAGRLEGKYYRFLSAKLGKVNFRSALEMGVNQNGLYLVPMLFFRLFHKPLRIPWNEIHAEPFKKFLFSGYRLSFQSFPDISMDLYDGTSEKMKDHLKAHTGFRQSPPVLLRRDVGNNGKGIINK